MGVVAEPDIGLAAEGRSLTMEQLTEADRWLIPAFAQREWPHMKPKDAACAGVAAVITRCGSGEDERAGGRLCIDRAAHQIPPFGQVMPFV